MDKRSQSQSPQPSWFEARPGANSPTVRVSPSAVNVINITRRPEGGIVNIEVRRQESPTGSSQNVAQSSTFGSRESSPGANVFARIPPLPMHESRHPIDVRLRGGLGGTLSMHRPLADLVRAMHGQSLFERFNEVAPPMITAAHSTVSTSGRRVHTIPIRVEGRQRMGGSAPPSPQRVYEIPVNVMSSKSQSQPSTPTGPPPVQKLFPTMNRTVLQSPTDMTNDAEKKLQSLMSHLESEMNFGPSRSPARKQLSEMSLPPLVISKIKSPPPYEGPHVPLTAVDAFGKPVMPAAFREVSVTSSEIPGVKRDFQQSPQTTPVQEMQEPKFKTKASPAELESQAWMPLHCLCSCCNEDISTIGEACQAMGRVYHTTCFCCVVCKRVLRGKAFYEVDGKIYCEEDYLKSGFHHVTTKCNMCGLVIADIEVQALGKSFHVGCFRCHVCNQCLSESSYTTDFNGRVLCVNDYYRLHSPDCATCGQRIVPPEGSYESVRVVMADMNYCIECFRCQGCGRKLSDKQSELCYPLGGQLLCYECHTKGLSSGAFDIGRSTSASSSAAVA